MRRAIALLLALGLISPAAAQVNLVPQVGTITATLNKYTYRAVSIGLVPAASATDIFCIAGSASRLVKVTFVDIRGVAGTLTTVPVAIVRRASVNTGGTAASTIANPANTIGKLDTQNPTAVATLIAYTANPTIVDTSPTYLATGTATFPTAAAGTSNPALNLTFGANLPQFTQQLTLRGASDQACINLQTSTVTTGSLDITIGWTEE